MKRKMSDEEKTKLLSISMSATVCASSLRRRPRGAAASLLPSPGCSSCRSSCSRHTYIHQARVHTSVTRAYTRQRIRTHAAGRVR